jgi:tRNA(fMet)-specific endonuclease VapC
MEEALRGRLGALRRARTGAERIIRYSYLAEAIRLFHRFPLVPYEQLAENQFQQIRQLRLRIGTRDQKIAAVALANKLTLLTRNRRDFSLIPGLTLDDWSV